MDDGVVVGGALGCVLVTVDVGISVDAEVVVAVGLGVSGVVAGDVCVGVKGVKSVWR